MLKWAKMKASKHESIIDCLANLEHMIFLHHFFWVRFFLQFLFCFFPSLLLMFIGFRLASPFSRQPQFCSLQSSPPPFGVHKVTPWQGGLQRR